MSIYIIHVEMFLHAHYNGIYLQTRYQKFIAVLRGDMVQDKPNFELVLYIDQNVFIFYQNIGEPGLNDILG